MANFTLYSPSHFKYNWWFSAYWLFMNTHTVHFDFCNCKPTQKRGYSRLKIQTVFHCTQLDFFKWRELYYLQFCKRMKIGPCSKNWKEKWFALCFEIWYIFSPTFSFLSSATWYKNKIRTKKYNFFAEWHIADCNRLTWIQVKLH